MAKKKYFLEDKYISVLRFIATGCNAKEFLFTWNQAFSYQCIIYMIFFNLANKVWGNIKQMFFPTLKKKTMESTHSLLPAAWRVQSLLQWSSSLSPLDTWAVCKKMKRGLVCYQLLWSTVWILSVVMVYSSCSNLSFHC